MFNEAQAPTGSVPLFLVISEIQRRQSMRQRYQANPAEGKGTVKDQILRQQATQGIPQQATQAPMGGQQSMGQGIVPNMPNSGMARLASGGIAPGGTVYMANSGEVPDANPSSPAGRWWDRIQEKDRLWLERREKLDKDEKDLALLNSAGFFGLFKTQSDAELEAANKTLDELQAQRLALYSGLPPPEEPPPKLGPNTFYNAEDSIVPDTQYLNDQLLNLGEFGTTNPEDQPRLGDENFRPPSLSDLGRFNPAQLDYFVEALANRTSPAIDLAARQEAEIDKGAALQEAEIDKGIGQFFPSRRDYPVELTDKELEFQTLQNQMMKDGLPAQVDLSSYRQSATQRGADAKADARRMAIAAALSGLGTGLMSGDTAGGMQRASGDALATLERGRTESIGEDRYAEQLAVQQAIADRQGKVEGIQMKSKMLEDQAARSRLNLNSAEENAIKWVNAETQRLYAMANQNSKNDPFLQNYESIRMSLPLKAEEAAKAEDDARKASFQPIMTSDERKKFKKDWTDAVNNSLIEAAKSLNRSVGTTNASEEGSGGENDEVFIDHEERATDWVDVSKR